MMREMIATYRLQLRAEFTLEDALALVPYLAELGVSELYLSPIFAARPGSTHGYDVVNMNEVNPELGGEEALLRLSEELRRRGMGLLLDVVPNHSAFHGTNRDLMNVLELGPSSPYYHHFDILWDHPYENIRGRILAPFLGEFYARCLARGELQLGYGEHGFFVTYYGITLPLSVRSYARILAYDLQQVTARFPQPNLPKLMALIEFIGGLDRELERQPHFDYAALIQEVLWELYCGDPSIRKHIDDNLRAFNGQVNNPASFDLLDRLLDEQFFRLSYWKVGTEELNYRRFFAINDLISLRMEEPSVFEHTHRLLMRLLEQGHVHGIRVDHVDGLYDPAGYLQALRARFAELYLVVEKILQREEQLPADWPVHGTTGYDFLDRATGLLCDEGNAEALERFYRTFTREHLAYSEIVRQSKREIAARQMAGDVDNLALLLKGITNRNCEGNDLTMYAVRSALLELLTRFPVYRTYVRPAHFALGDRDVFAQVLEQAMRGAEHVRGELDLLRTFIERLFQGQLAEDERAEWTNFTMRLQQYTSPLMAKGVEDTAFYRYLPLAARTEVGSNAERLGYSSEEFHAFMRRRAASYPAALNALATHDTKRGEDTRARTCVLSADLASWRQFVAAAHRLNRRYRAHVQGSDYPTARDEYLLYQTLLGAVPFAGTTADSFLPRLEAYLIKAAREAKQETSWLNPSASYEGALVQFARQTLDEQSGAEFLRVLRPYWRKVARFGISNSLSQTLLKLTCPGIPDIYQGGELWDFSLVDPDNRRPVDYAQRRLFLQQIRAGLACDPAALLAELSAQPEDGRLKLLLLHQGLQVRRERSALFLQGSYEPLHAQGECRQHVVAFARAHQGDLAVTVVTRLLCQLQPEWSLGLEASLWRETALTLPPTPRGLWRECLTGRTLRSGEAVPLAWLTAQLPVALLTNW